MQIRSRQYFTIAVIIVINIAIGCIVVTDYGESQDEHLRIRYAKRSLAAYTEGKRVSIDEKGPSYVMLALLGSQALRGVWGSLHPIEAWHFMHFLSFLMGVYFLYLICRHYMSEGAALATGLLFNTQPLLWGHAWINPKDIPFMSFFLGSVALGMQMASLSGSAAQNSGYASRGSSSADQTVFSGLADTLSTDWRLASPRKRYLLIGACIFLLALLFGLLLADAPIRDWIANLVGRAYADDNSSLLGRLFNRLAENMGSTPVELYIQKGQAAYRRLLAGYAMAMPLLWLALAGLLLPRLSKRVWRERVRPFLGAIVAGTARRQTLLAALFLGLASAIRAIGPASGMLVAVYCLWKSGRKAFPSLLAYFAVAGLVTYVTWPGLWSSPLQGYLSAFGEASDFPWEGKVMFAGVDVPVSELPRSYLPILLALQLTVPVLVLFMLGLSLAILDFRRNREKRPALALAALWLFAPLAGVMVVMPTMYDNFRQFLFMTPPLFIFAGIGVGKLFLFAQRLRRLSPPDDKPNALSPVLPYAVRILILAIALFPGLYWDVVLHPYQYIYYNQLVGGVGGAYRRYEMDYWATSYREASEYLNARAPDGARVVVYGADHIVKSYARKDLEISDLKRVDSRQDYAVITTRHDKDLELYPSAPIVFQVGRDGAIFTVIKRLSPQEQP